MGCLRVKPITVNASLTWTASRRLLNESSTPSTNSYGKVYVDERERRQGRGESRVRRNGYVKREGKERTPKWGRWVYVQIQMCEGEENMEESAAWESKNEMTEIYTEELWTKVKWDGTELKGSEWVWRGYYGYRDAIGWLLITFGKWLKYILRNGERK